MKNSYKITVEIVTYFVVLAFVTCYVYKALAWKNSAGIQKFYEYDKDTVDVMLYGSSHIHCSVNTALMWNDEGIAVCDMSEGGQNLGNTYYYIIESLKTQSPQIIIVDLYKTAQLNDGVKTGNFYRNILGMKFSNNYVKNLRYSLDLTMYEKKEKTNYFKWLMFRFPIFHSRYKEITKKDFEKIDITNGRYSGSWTRKVYEAPYDCLVTDIEPISDREINYLDKIVELAEKNDIDLVFIVAPYLVTADDMRKYNFVKAYAYDKGVPFINFNEMYEEIGFDFFEDMRDEEYYGSHLNNYGAEKVTNYLTKYISENYDIPDRRGDERYNIYQTICDNWFKSVEEHNRKLKNS